MFKSKYAFFLVVGLWHTIAHAAEPVAPNAVIFRGDVFELTYFQLRGCTQCYPQADLRCFSSNFAQLRKPFPVRM